MIPAGSTVFKCWMTDIFILHLRIVRTSYSRCIKARTPPSALLALTHIHTWPPNLPTHTDTHFLNWKWNAAVFPAALWILPLICYEKYPQRGIFHWCPRKPKDLDLTLILRRGGGARVCAEQKYIEVKGTLLSETWVRGNKHVTESKQGSVGKRGAVFVSPSLHHPFPEGTVALFNVDPSSVYPDVELPAPLVAFKL